MDMPGEQDGVVAGAQSIRRALAILSALAAGGEAGLSLAEVTRTTGLTRPTVHRILRVLAEEGVVEQRRDTRRYAIGEQIPMLALARSSRSPILSIAEPFLRSAAERVGDTIFLTVKTGLDALCVARRLGPYPVQVFMIQVGARRPLGASLAGIAILSLFPRDEASSILHRNEVRFAPFRMTASRALGLVDLAREHGYALRQRGLVAGTRGVSVPIAASSRTPAAALTVAAVDRRLATDRVPAVVEILRESAAAIEEKVAAYEKRSAARVSRPISSGSGRRPAS